MFGAQTLDELQTCAPGKLSSENVLHLILSSHLVCRFRQPNYTVKSLAEPWQLALHLQCNPASYGWLNRCCLENLFSVLMSHDCIHG